MANIRLNMNRFDLHHIINAMHCSVGVEIGVARGEYSYYLLKNSNLNVLWSVDSWSGKYANMKIDAIRNMEEFRHRSSIRHMSSLDAAKYATTIKHKFDFIYIDANHRRGPVLDDVKAWFPLLNRPGIFAGHDYVNGERMTNVCPAVDELSERIGATFYLTKERWATWFFILGEES